MSTDPPSTALSLGAVHLLAAGELFRPGYGSTSVALCGEPVTSGPGGEEDPRYCRKCVRAAIRWNAAVVTAPGPGPSGCPSREATSGGRRVACESPEAGAGSRAACGCQWWIPLVNPWHYLNWLTGEVAARTVLREVVALAGQAPGLSDGQLRARLIRLLAPLDQHARGGPG